jgi:hypothetical protein
MIEGLKVTVVGTEMRELCVRAADYHAERVRVYDQQLASMQDSNIEAANMTGGDPMRALTERKSGHQNKEHEMRFVAAHIDLGEQYLLDWDALHKLGIVKDRY